MMLTTEHLWITYARVQVSQATGVDCKRQLTYLIPLVRFGLGVVRGLKPLAVEIDKRFQTWIFHDYVQRGINFMPKQTE